MSDADPKKMLSPRMSITIISVYFYVLMEWLFFATKPSFLSNLGLPWMMKVLLITPVSPALAATLLAALITLPAFFVRKRPIRNLFFSASLFVPSIVVALTFFLMIDNFTYTVFKFGVVRTQNYQGFVYGFLVLVLIALSYQLISSVYRKLEEGSRARAAGYISATLVLASLIAAFVFHDYSGLISFEDSGSFDQDRKLPNIIILASDGMNAENMSVYGYERNTTPYISDLAREGLLCENCFTNAGSSGGSIASMFTGKLPSQTRMIYPPDILKGKDSFQHLPAIFKRLGYKNFDISIKHYADPYDLNLKKSFDWANSRKYEKMDNLFSKYFGILLGNESDYFLLRMYDRISSRLTHSFTARKMDDVYSEVTGIEKKRKARKKNRDPGGWKINKFFEFVDETDAPFFAHLHLLGTHGPKFNPRKKIFSEGLTEINEWMVDFYDDAILDFDNKVRDLVKGLKRRGLLDNTVIVICTDHGMGFKITSRLPLIFIFPEGEHSGRIPANTQNLDIGATLLDYLGISQPEWMGGLSLITDAPAARKYIYTFDRKHGIEIHGGRGIELDRSRSGPPFYTIGSIGIIHRQRLFQLHLDKSVMRIIDVTGHTDPCGEDEMPSIEEIEQLMISHMEENGYDISSIERPVKMEAP